MNILMYINKYMNIHIYKYAFLLPSLALVLSHLLVHKGYKFIKACEFCRQGSKL